MNSRLALVLLPAILAAGCARQGGGQSIAEVSGKTITPEAFAHRYAAFLNVSSSRDNILVRKRVLDNMINEQLIFADARAKGIDTSAEVRDELERIRQQALLVAEAKRITVDTMRITEEELQSEFRRYNTQVDVRYVYGRTAAEAAALKRRLEHGATFQTVAREVFSDPGLATNGGYLGSFGYGEMEPALEEAAMTLPVGALSDPVRIAAGFAVIRVEHRTVQPLASAYDYAKVKEKLAANIQERRAMAIITAASHGQAERLAAVFDEPTVDAVMEAWPQFAGNGRTEVESASLPAGLTSKTLVRFPSGAWSVGEFAEKLRRTTPGQRRRVHTRAQCEDLVRGLAVREELTGSAAGAKLDTTADFTRHMADAATEVLLKRWAQVVADSIDKAGWDEPLLRKTFAEQLSQYAIPPERNVAEILVRTYDEAAALRKKLDGGASFAALARAHSIRLWAAPDGGELGFGPMAKYGTLAETLFAARPGVVLGPLKVDPYWGLFTVRGVHEGRPKTFEEARTDVEASLAAARKQELLRARVEGLRKSASIVIHEDVLENVTPHL